jgi:hypothetical protein
MARFGWQQHDGRHFGRHEAADQFSGVRMRSSFVKQVLANIFINATLNQ